jgi:hypothetical protein
LRRNGERSINPMFHTKYHCIPAASQWTVAVASGVFSVFSDVYSVLLPEMLLLKIKVACWTDFHFWIEFPVSTPPATLLCSQGANHCIVLSS